MMIIISLFLLLSWSSLKRRSSDFNGCLSDFNGECLYQHNQVTRGLLWGCHSSYVCEDTPTMKAQSRKSQREEKKTMKAEAAAIEKAAKAAKVKLTTRVTSPLFFDVSDKRYELMGIIFHVGLTPQRGHYTSMVRSDKHNSQHAWFLTNDATVSMLTEKDVSNIVSSTAVPCLMTK